MNKISISLIVILIIFASCGSNTTQSERREVNPDGTAKLKFEETTHDFGNIMQGEKVTHIFKYTNTGDANLIIADIKSSCGCTVPNYSQKPVAPGEESEIKVTFNSAGKNGKQHKTITLKSNAEQAELKLVIKANIKKPE